MANFIPPLAQARLREAEAREAAMKEQEAQNEQSTTKTKKAHNATNS
jgi:hypothetical protein